MEKIKVFGVSSSDCNFLVENSPDMFQKVSNFANADVIIMPGGSDWNPKFYNQKTGRKTYFHDHTDYTEMIFFMKALLSGKYILGICRGAQGLCIMNGGSLIQHVTNHAISELHEIITINGRKLKTNSLHHQMLDLNSIPKQNWKLLAYSKPRSFTYLNGNDEEICNEEGVQYRDALNAEPEIVKFTDVHGLAVQGHPEFASMPTETINYIICELIIGYNEFKAKSFKDRAAYKQSPHTAERLSSIASELLKDPIRNRVDEVILKRVADIKNMKNFDFNIFTNTSNNDKSETETETNRYTSIEKHRWEY